jgi:hypothetical protein
MWVGDYLSNNINGRWHYAFNGYGGDHVWDYNVYNAINNNGDSKQRFNFIWTCANGGVYWDDVYGNQNQIEGIGVAETEIPWYTPDNTHTWYGYIGYWPGAVGMPYAWTGDAPPTMSNNYCYVGFEVSSPFLQVIPPSGWTSTSLAYAHFPCYFYGYALGPENDGIHGSILGSLNYAAKETFGTHGGEYYTYEDSILNIGKWYYENKEGMEGWWYWRMRVFGDWSMVLPEY